MPSFIDLSGMKFGRLTVLERDNRHFGRGDHTYWVCKCECGKISKVRPDALKSGAVVSCGCYHSHVSSEIGKYVNLRHGMTKTRIFKIWSGMKERCTNPKIDAYKNYGARGIYVCKIWSENFESFLNWSLENGYSPKLQIDRIDNNGPYSPDNCRWVTPRQNSRNRRSNKSVIINGEKYETIAEASERLGISSSCICNQTKKYGYNISFEERGKCHKWTIGR